MIDLKLVENVREYVTGMAVRTPCLPSEWLTGLYGANVWIKCENLQHTGSFKIRGPLARLPFLSKDERLCGVLCASAGNHGKGLAWAANHYGIRCTVCVPKTLHLNKEAAIKRYKAQVIKTEFDNFDDTQVYAMDLAKKTGRVWISPFDDDYIQAGNGGTTMLEILEEIPKCDALLLPVGGGGLAVGAGVVARAKSARTKIIGVNTDASPAMWLSRKENRAITKVQFKPSIAEGVEGGVSENTYKLGLDVIDDMLLVKESHLSKAIAEFMRRHRMALEGSAALPIAAMMDGLLPKGFKRVCVLLSGGNIDASRIKDVVNAHY